MPFEVVRDAYDRMFACFDASGVPYSGPRTYVDDTGFPMITYVTYDVAGMSEDEMSRVTRACVTRESEFIEQLYQSQPSYIEAADRAWDQALPQILACLRDNGVVIDDDATRSEVVYAVLTLAGSVHTDDGRALGPDCTLLLPNMGYS